MPYSETMWNATKYVLVFTLSDTHTAKNWLAVHTAQRQIQTDVSVSVSVAGSMNTP